MSPEALEWLVRNGHTVGNEVCAKCWADSYTRTLEDGRPQQDHYIEVAQEVEREAESVVAR